jgi:hypothetical protein
MSNLSDEEIIYWSTRITGNILELMEQMYLDMPIDEEEFNKKQAGVMRFHKALRSVAARRDPKLRTPSIIYKVGNA